MSQNLRVLSLGESVGLTDMIVKLISRSKYLSNLKELALNSCSKLTNKSFEYFLTPKCLLIKIELIDFSHTKITGSNK